MDGLSPPYSVILADPPWKFSSNSKSKPGRNAFRHYDCMTAAEIAALPVASIAARDAVLYLWVTVPFLEAGLAVLKAWGFAYKSNIAWDKERIGTGYWARNAHEHVLIGRRGVFPTPPPHARPASVIRGQRREHSRKPDQLHADIEAAWPDARRVELFARQRRSGWDCWGNETDKFEAAS